MCDHFLSPNRFRWLGLLALLLLAPSPASAQNCPQTDNDQARERLEYIFTAPAYEPERELFAIQSDGYARARAVTNSSHDAWICDALTSSIQVPAYLSYPWQYTIYEADGKYYLVWVKLPLEQTRIRIQNGRLKGESYRAPFGVFDAVGWRLFSDMT
jgi:hypothetical protein